MGNLLLQIFHSNFNKFSWKILNLASKELRKIDIGMYLIMDISYNEKYIPSTVEFNSKINYDDFEITLELISYIQYIGDGRKGHYVTWINNISKKMLIQYNDTSITEHQYSNTLKTPRVILTRVIALNNV